ncbi:MAG: hypothetical protein JOZ02_10940 [Acidobacteria bacterium]|nr:hypothetical protein [Acidobacteriota bacterium]
MPDKQISATLSEADRQAVLDAINIIRAKLPFLIDLTPAERKSLPKMGSKGRGFVDKALEVAEQNPDIVPRSFDVEEMRRDVKLFEALLPLVTAFAQLNELLNDTYTAVGSEAFVAALRVYQFVRAAGKGSALDGAIESLGQRFTRKPRTRPGNKTPDSDS